MTYADDFFFLQLWGTGWCLVVVNVRKLKWHSNCGIVITDPIPTVTNDSDSFASFGFVLIAADCEPRYHSESIQREADRLSQLCFWTTAALCSNWVYTFSVEQRLNQLALNSCHYYFFKLRLHKSLNHFTVSAQWSRLPALAGSW